MCPGDTGAAHSRCRRATVPRALARALPCPGLVLCQRPACRVMECWTAVHESKWRHATLAGVVFAPLYPVTAMPMPVPVAMDELADGDFLDVPPEDAASQEASVAPQAQPATLAPAWQPSAPIQLNIEAPGRHPCRCRHHGAALVPSLCGPPACSCPACRMNKLSGPQIRPCATSSQPQMPSRA